jgi:hypothetical protein
MRFFRSDPASYDGPTFPEFGVPFGHVKAGIAEKRVGEQVCWPLRVTQIRQEGGSPVHGVPLTQFLDCEFEGYDVWLEKEAPFDWVEETDTRLGHFYVDVTVDPYQQQNQVVPIAADLIAANDSGALKGASSILVHGELRRIGDRSSWAGPGAKISPAVNAQEVLWQWWPDHAVRYMTESPNHSAYRDMFSEDQRDPGKQAEAAAQALQDGWWSNLPT